MKLTISFHSKKVRISIPTTMNVLLLLSMIYICIAFTAPAAKKQTFEMWKRENVVNQMEYDIPDWVNKKVFSHNKKTTKLNKKSLSRDIDRMYRRSSGFTYIDLNNGIDYDTIKKTKLPFGLLQPIDYKHW